MAISPSLAKFVSSGVYRLVIDRSQVINNISQTLRLIIGFSKKGPFNTPVFVQDSVFFRAIFGDVDTQLERKGSFFHRSVLTCLERGPVVVLNLLNLDDDQDTADFRSISTATWQANSARVNTAVSSFFNKDKFWFSDPKALISTATDTDVQSAAANRLLNVANVGRKTISVITKKSDILGFDAIAKDYFGAGQVPEFMRDNDYIYDFLVDARRRDHSLRGQGQKPSFSRKSLSASLMTFFLVGFHFCDALNASRAAFTSSSIWTDLALLFPLLSPSGTGSSSGTRLVLAMVDALI
jgi:hypothetical protein